MDQKNQSNFNKWAHLLGKYDTGAFLTIARLEKWSSDPNHKYVCTYCRRVIESEEDLCSDCKEYKGILPLIKGWSDGE